MTTFLLAYLTSELLTGLIQEPVARILPASVSDDVFGRLVDGFVVLTLAMPGFAIVMGFAVREARKPAR